MKKELNPKNQNLYDEIITCINKYVICGFYQKQLISMIDELLDNIENENDDELRRISDLLKVDGHNSKHQALLKIKYLLGENEND